MPRTFETTVYKYGELSAEAQEKARDWWRDLEARSGDMFFAESVTDDFKEILAACGFDLHTRGDKHDMLYWRGFSSQGDGACFSASWSASCVNVAFMLDNRPATYEHDGATHTCETNSKLRPLLERTAALATDYPTGCGSVAANDRYMSTRLESAATDDGDDVELGEALQSLAQDLAHYFYRALESEYEYTLADEQVAETIIANEYEFTADGRPA